MVQKEAKPADAPKRRGRPPAYDRGRALAQATNAFWKAGYSGTSLDVLAAATNMNRPSLYAAFGDKRALYLHALDGYWQLAFAAMDEALSHDEALGEALMRVYDKALEVYFPRGGRPRGCFAIGTATTEAMEDARIRAAFLAGLRKLDQSFEARMALARDKGELDGDADPQALAMLASATLHTLAIRARSGTARQELKSLARKAVCVICARRREPTN